MNDYMFYDDRYEICDWLEATHYCLQRDVDHVGIISHDFDRLTWIAHISVLTDSGGDYNNLSITPIRSLSDNSLVFSNISKKFEDFQDAVRDLWKSVDLIIFRKNLLMTIESDDSNAKIMSILASHDVLRQQFIAGNTKAKNALVGKVMKEARDYSIETINKCIDVFLKADVNE